MKLVDYTVAALLAAALPAASAAAQWQPVTDPGDFDQIEIFLPGSGEIYSGTVLGQVYASGDHGVTWTAVGSGLDSNYEPVQSMALVSDWLIMSRSGFGEYNYRSHLEGGSWSAWEPLAWQGAAIRSLAEAGGVAFGLFGTVVERSDDQGATWTPVNTPGPVSDLFVAQGRLFASQQLINQGSLFRSSDLGQSWTDITGPVTSSYVCSHALWQGRVLLSVYRGGGIGTIYSSADLGDSWQVVTGLPTNRNINGMAVAGDGSLAIGASGSDSGASIWLSPDLSAWTDFTGNLPGSAQPFNDLLSQDGWFFKTGGTVTAYRAESPGAAATGEEAAAAAVPLEIRPNPVPARAEVDFSLDSAALVSFEVFDAAGRCLSRIDPVRYAAGSHHLVWDARDRAGTPLPAGVYFARLRHGRLGQTARLVIASR